MEGSNLNLNNDDPLDYVFRLNYKRTMLIGFAYFGILLIWQVYDSWCPTFLTELFSEAFPGSEKKDVQYLVGIMMALDNLAALIMLPIFGRLSDKTKTRIGKRMPYILFGTILASIFLPFIPVFFHFHSLGGLIAMMAITIFFATIARNPAVSLMPDITPKPLRSKGNGVINMMGFIGGLLAVFLGIVFSLSSYREDWIKGSGDIWLIEAPFLIASIVYIISALVLFLTLKENKIAKEMKEEMELGDKASLVEGIEADKPMTKDNRRMLWLILGAEFLWFMADNGINTFIGNYTIYYLLAQHKNSMITLIAGGIGSILGFGLGAIASNKIGRKWSIIIGLAITFLGLFFWLILSLAIPVNEANPDLGIYNPFPTYLYVVWFIKSFGMSIVNVNALPMAIDLCSNEKIGEFTGYYFASSMAAQTITPIALGSLLLIPSFSFKLLPLYALVLIGISGLLFLFIRNIRRKFD